MLQREEIFREDASLYADTTICGKQTWSTCVHTLDSTRVINKHTVIDVLSKYTWAIPLKSKSGNEMSETIAKIICDDKRYPKNFQTDRGKEFYNASVQKLMKKHNINHYSTYSVMKASIVERFNRT